MTPPWTKAGLDVNDAGYLPYAMMDAWQQLGRDFAYWRVLNAAEKRETNMERQAWYRADRIRREALILRDIGVMGHYVGDGSQPHHTSIHYNGWGDFPNPEGFTNSRQTHAVFEGEFTNRVARLDAVEAAMPAARLDGFDVKARTVSYLTTTLGTVIPFYRLEKAGGFRDTATCVARPSSTNVWRRAPANCATSLSPLEAVQLNVRTAGITSVGVIF